MVHNGLGIALHVCDISALIICYVCFYCELATSYCYNFKKSDSVDWLILINSRYP